MKKGKKAKPPVTPVAKLKLQIKALRNELDEAQETLRAIRYGEVDALVVNIKQGHQIFTLKDADQPYRVLVENMNEGAVTLSSDGTIFYCNRRFSEYMKLPIKMLIGTPIFAFIKPDELDRFIEIFTLHRSSKIFSDDFFFIFRPGKFIPLRITMSSTQIDDKKGICMIATDLTQQIRQNEYEQISKDLQIAIQARDEFISIASHELKTPLTTLLIFSQMQRKMIAQNDPRAFEEKRVIHIAEKTEALTSKLNVLVEDMLDITKLKSGQLKLVKEKMDLGKLTKAVLSRMSTIFTEAGYEQPKFKNTRAIGNWDPMRLEQVLNNLLTNAIKYGNQTAIEVVVTSSKGYARLTVKDKGEGIMEADQFKIFGRFERAISASEISGLGLGLFISKQIIEAHNGIIWVYSKNGNGSTFSFEIPMGLE
ncbi:MAG TPA: PAS domain-containing sensor histidine kinase [Bacteriovoracaceae bacterium]|nr:PAS domain-containing sensor histidine kinase [Bacteriovoracaceae bacterium]